jgi:Family of unknown function (DUF6011)
MTEDDEMSAFFDRLDSRNSPSSPASVRREQAEPTPEERHKCLQCDGTGHYRGMRTRQEQAHCFNCGGRGWLRRPYHEHMKAKAERKAKGEATRANNLQAKREAFDMAHPGLVASLQGMAKWNSFAADMLRNLAQWGSLTENQTAACLRMIAKVQAKREEMNKGRAERSGAVPMAAIEAMFKAANNAGLKRPRFLTERLKLELAPVHGRNAGAIYVKCDGAYAGKIAGGQFMAIRAAPQDTLDLLRTIAANPIEAARKYGRDTETCSCCGKKLTDPVSVANGVGPICASNWGI